MTKSQRLFLATAVATYILVVIGGTVRVTNSGEACPDWPTCNGRLVPSFNEHVIIEYSHRLFASLVSVLVVAAAIVAWRALRRDRTVVSLATAAVGVLIAQVLLGAATVKAELPASVVTAHLGTAMLLFAVTVLLALASFPKLRARAVGGVDGAAGARTVRNCALAAAAGMYVLLLSGAYLASSDNGLACNTWPLCNGQVFGHGSRGVEQSMLHRMLVVLVTVLLLGLAWVAARRQGRNYLLRHAVRDAIGLFVVQIFIGALNVWTELATGVRVVHLAVGALLWAALVTIGWLAWLAASAPREAKVGASAQPVRGAERPRSGVTG